MTRPFAFFITLAALLFVSACASHTTQSDADKNNIDLTLGSIVVLQCEHDPLDRNQAGRMAESHDLDEGCRALDSIIAEFFAMKENVNILSAIQQESLTGTFIGPPAMKARHIGMQAQADAVLTTRLLRYNKLIGKKYGADEPASVSFEYSLVHLASGKTLCRGSYEETQETLFSDLFSFGKASKRKFEFVSADTLLREGVEHKFSTCRHLTTP